MADADGGNLDDLNLSTDGPERPQPPSAVVASGAADDPPRPAPVPALAWRERLEKWFGLVPATMAGWFRFEHWDGAAGWKRWLSTMEIASACLSVAVFWALAGLQLIEFIKLGGVGTLLLVPLTLVASVVAPSILLWLFRDARVRLSRDEGFRGDPSLVRVWGGLMAGGLLVAGMVGVPVLLNALQEEGLIGAGLTVTWGAWVLVGWMGALVLYNGKHTLGLRVDETATLGCAGALLCRSLTRLVMAMLAPLAGLLALAGLALAVLALTALLGIDPSELQMLKSVRYGVLETMTTTMALGAVLAPLTAYAATLAGSFALNAVEGLATLRARMADPNARKKLPDHE